ncbi:type II secretion system F family protein [Nocardiopsis sp. MG754419]|uniref:type II secretion system F family protein n=1 Tax=Nocardiopsis sp. MG754419 TaxID=2259865 RepID=UPI001BA6ADF5|nr:type II secretion system F family protein [Nocardiopsis sp. MG754419]MBR8743356.1 type II secretion system (T2SS), F family protein [Nocardiopsis sp. MG754419]
MNLLPLLAATVSALLVVIGCYGLYLSMSQTRIPVDDPAARPVIKSDGTFFLHRITEAIGRPFTGSVLASLTDKHHASIFQRIEASGRVDGLTVERYVRRKIGEVALYGTLAALLLLSGNALFALVMLAFVGLTDLSMYVNAQQRADQVQSQLPDFLDVLAVTVSAGMSFRAAVARVADSMPGVLSDEFVIALRQMELGISRREAFDALRRRNRNESLSKFVTAIQQAEELGAPLSDTLAVISTDMRRADAQYMRRKAQQLNPRVTVVTATTLLPGLLILIVGSMILGSDIDFGVLLGG